jgi:hypothetical protein
MNLVTLIVILAVVYVGWQYLQTFKGMVDELKEMRMKCMGTATPPKVAQPSIRETLLSALEHMKNQSKK